MNKAHPTTLQARHADLETRIAAEAGRPRPDTGLIAEWKKQKLRLKEEFGKS